MIDISSIKPTQKRVLISMDDASKQTKGGVFLIDNMEANNPRTGTIIAKDEKLEGYDVGTRVLFNQLAVDSRKLVLNDVDYIMTETDYIMAFI